MYSAFFAKSDRLKILSYFLDFLVPIKKLFLSFYQILQKIAFFS